MCGRSRARKGRRPGKNASLPCWTHYARASARSNFDHPTPRTRIASEPQRSRKVVICKESICFGAKRRLYEEIQLLFGGVAGCTCGKHVVGTGTGRATEKSTARRAPGRHGA